MSGFFLANPWGLLALLGIPAILLIHFLQRPGRYVTISTLFLINRVTTDNFGGKKLERFRQSLPLWLQLLAVLLITWLLIQPRWTQQVINQQVVIVLDSSASMGAFHEEAINAVDKLSDDLSSIATDTSWLLLSSHRSVPPLYNGTNRSEMLAALNQWQPNFGRHDLKPVFELAISRQGSRGISVLVTDRKVEVPDAMSIVQVGRPLDNIAIVGADVTSRDGQPIWQAVIQNFSGSAKTVNWSIRTEQGVLSQQSLALDAEQLHVLQGGFPPSVERIELVLDDKVLPIDNRIPFVKPSSKAFSVFLAGNDPSVDSYMQKLIDRDDSLGSAQTQWVSDLVIVNRDHEIKEPAHMVFSSRLNKTNRDANPIIVESHPLVEGLNWQALLTSGVGTLSANEGDQVLLWQGDQPLLFLRQTQAYPTLFINFDFHASNADRLPAFLLMTHRYIQWLRQSKLAYSAENIRVAQKNELPQADQSLSLQWQDNLAAAYQPLEHSRFYWQAPNQPGFVRAMVEGQPLMNHAVQFYDPFESDLRTASSHYQMASTLESLQQKYTEPDPYRRVWLLLLLLLLVAIWFAQALNRGGDE